MFSSAVFNQRYVPLATGPCINAASDWVRPCTTSYESKVHIRNRFPSGFSPDESRRNAGFWVSGYARLARSLFQPFVSAPNKRNQVNILSTRREWKVTAATGSVHYLISVSDMPATPSQTQTSKPIRQSPPTMEKTKKNQKAKLILNMPQHSNQLHTSLMEHKTRKHFERVVG